MKQCDFESQFSDLFPDYHYEAPPFFQFCRDNSMDLSIDAVRAYQLSIPRYLKFGTFNKRLSASKKIVEQWTQRIDPESLPVVMFQLKSIKGMKKADSTVLPDQWHTPEVIRKLISAAGKRTGAIMQFFACTGLRRAELAFIRQEDLSPTSNGYSIRIHGKGNKERVINVDADVVDYAGRIFKGNQFLFEAQSGDPYVLNDLTKMVTNAGKRVGIKTSPHRLRHSFATQFLTENPGKFKELSLYLGHSSVNITMDLYAHVEAQVEDLRKATAAFKMDADFMAIDIATKPRIRPT